MQANLRARRFDGEIQALQLNIEHAAACQQHGIEASASRLIGTACVFNSACSSDRAT